MGVSVRGHGWSSSQPTLSDSTVVLRPWVRRDAPSVVRACQDLEIQRWTQVPVPYRLDDAVYFIREYAPQQWAQRQGASFAVLDAATGTLVGSCALANVDTEASCAEVGYWVAPWGRGRRFAQHGTQLLCDWAFSDAGLGELRLLVEAENLASRSVPQRLGFALDSSKTVTRAVRDDQREYLVYRMARP